MRHISNKKDFPVGKHYAALEFTSMYVEGDERSRTNPGHGYPAHSIPKVEYIFLNSEQKLQEYIKKKESPNYGSPERNYIIIEAEKKEVEVQIIAKIK